MISFWKSNSYNNHEKLLGIKMDNKLSFEEHVSELCSKVSQKLHALCRVTVYMKPLQRIIIMKAFISSQFGYCPLVWMFHRRNYIIASIKFAKEHSVLSIVITFLRSNCRYKHFNDFIHFRCYFVLY